jgi:hypothetical protein
MTVVQVPITPLSGATPLRQDHLERTLGRPSERKKNQKSNERFVKVDISMYAGGSARKWHQIVLSGFRGLVLAATIARRAAI